MPMLSKRSRENSWAMTPHSRLMRILAELTDRWIAAAAKQDLRRMRHIADRYRRLIVERQERLYPDHLKPSARASR